MSVNGGEFMPQTNELLASREPYFAEVDIETSDIFCGDEREPLGVKEPYIHMFGGALNVPFNSLIVTAATDLNTPLPTLAAAATADIFALKAANIQGLGVHSDTHAEEGEDFQRDRQDGKVGCGYSELRQHISHTIVKNRNEILDDAERLFPELFADLEGYAMAQRIISSHEALAGRADTLGTGRSVVQAAIKAGAKVMLVDGNHVATQGIINTQPGTSFKSGEALRDGLPTYDHDHWAGQELFKRTGSKLDPRMFQRASIIDAIGTMKALGVTEIARR
jgi:hypothetical protein